MTASNECDDSLGYDTTPEFNAVARQAAARVPAHKLDMPTNSELENFHGEIAGKLHSDELVAEAKRCGQFVTCIAGTSRVRRPAA